MRKFAKRKRGMPVWSLRRSVVNFLTRAMRWSPQCERLRTIIKDYKRQQTMGLLDFIFKSRKERDAWVKNALKRADDTMARIEKGLERMKKDDELWKKGY